MRNYSAPSTEPASSSLAKSPEGFGPVRGSLSSGSGDHSPGWEEYDPSRHAAGSNGHMPPYRADRKAEKLPLAAQFRARVKAAKRAKS